MEHFTRARAWTDDELLALPKDGHRFELIAGGLHDMSPGGALHGAVSIRIASLLWQHVELNQLGVVFDGQIRLSGIRASQGRSGRFFGSAWAQVERSR
jgi:Uma2 family endonuclease